MKQVRLRSSSLLNTVKTRFYVPATYSEDGSKVSGVRSVKAAHYAIDKLVEYFGDMDIGKIDDEIQDTPSKNS